MIEKCYLCILQSKATVMARKVLLSFLGTGPLDSKETRTYKTAEYHMGEENLGNYPFVASALKKYYQTDSVLLVGTVHSMWEEVYRWFSEDEGKEVDDEVYYRIANECETSNYRSPLQITDQAAIEHTLGNDSKVILIKYGINEAEVMENINIILGLQQYLRTNDELIVDITHSFRSLPMFMMNLLIYLQNVSPKKITISHIHYGMLEMNKELGYAPIIDLKAMMQVNDWITGAYSFSMFGNAYKISRLMENEDKGVSNLLYDFSNLMNLNDIYNIQNIAQRLSAVKNKEYSTLLPTLTITPIVNNFVSRFGTKGKQSAFQLKVAKWQLEHKKYAQALLTVNEAIITFVCETLGLDWSDFDNREGCKGELKNYYSTTCSKDLKKIYKNLKGLRNSTAHNIENTKSMNDIIKILTNSMKELENIIK